MIGGLDCSLIFSLSKKLPRQELIYSGGGGEGWKREREERGGGGVLFPFVVLFLNKLILT